MANSISSSKNANNSNIKVWLGCLVMIMVYFLIIYGLFSLWSRVDAATVFDGWQPTYP